LHRKGRSCPPREHDLLGGLRLLEREEQKLETLRHLIAEGRASGTAEYSYETFMAELDKELN
jgi:antitoxin ParD1/3/4